MQERSQDTDTTDGKTLRRSRNADTRDFEGRSVTSRSPIAYGRISKFNLPEEFIKDYEAKGYVVGFIVYSLANSEHRENYYQAIDRGWIPVKASDHPSLVRNYQNNPFGKKDEMDEFIIRGGQIAMIRRQEDHDAEKGYYDSENIRIDYMRKMYEAHQLDPRAPVPFLDERRRGVH